MDAGGRGGHKSREYPWIYFEKEGKWWKFSSEVDFRYCVMGPCPEQKLSNADRIRAMSDEALAAFQTPTRYALQHREVLL